MNHLLKRMLTLTLVCIGLLWMETASAQDFNQRHNNRDYMYQGNSVEREERSITFYFFPYNGTLVDLRPYKRLELIDDIPDQISISPPDMRTFSDTSIGIGHLEYYSRKDTIYIPVICVVGDMNSPQPIFYFDRNLDRDYLFEDPIIFSTRRKFYNVTLKDEKEGKTYGFTLDNFKMTEAKNAIREMKRQQRRRIVPDLPPRNHQLTADLNLNIGFGQMRYAYIVDSTGLPVTYLRNSSATGFAGSLNYSWQQWLNVEGRLAFDNIFYWTSTKTVYVNQGLLLEKINRDILPARRFSAEFNLGINQQIGSDILLRTYVGYSFYRMSQRNNYQPERSIATTYELQRRNFIIVGLRPHVQINSRNIAFIDIAYKTGQFYAEGFFEAESASQVNENSLSEFRIGLGMNYRFL